jgi:hypothetical protein
VWKFPEYVRVSLHPLKLVRNRTGAICRRLSSDQSGILDQKLRLSRPHDANTTFAAKGVAFRISHSSPFLHERVLDVARGPYDCDEIPQFSALRSKVWYSKTSHEPRKTLGVVPAGSMLESTNGWTLLVGE